MTALISGLGGEAGFGEAFLDRNDDRSTLPLDITSIFENGLNFFGREFTELWVNNNGSVTFNGPRSTFTPNVITEASDNPEITPFFADVDTRGGAIDPTPGGNSTGSNLVHYDFDTVQDRIIVTWDDVGYYSNRTDKLNAFQLILQDVGEGDFNIEFRYEAVNWTAGNASGGTDGLGGVTARAGYTAGTGDPNAFFELPASGDEAAMLALEDTPGNTGADGQWLFRVRSGDIVQADIPPLPPVGATGWTSGDPHLATLDGFNYSFQAAGEYVLTRDIDGSGLEVQARFVPAGENASITEAVAARVGDSTVQIDAADATPVSVDGAAVEIENFGSIAVDGGRVYREDDTYTIVYNDADARISRDSSQVIVDVVGSRLDVAMRLSTDHVGAVEGLLGNADGNPDNDVALADGTVLARPLAFDDLYGAYRDDWRVTTEAQSLFTYDAGESLAGFYLPDMPAEMPTRADFTPEEVTAAERLATEAGLTPGSVAFENAVIDVLITGDASFVASAVSVPEAGIRGIVGELQIGTDADEVLTGGAEDDLLRGRGGDDRLVGLAGDDTLDGGNGVDTLIGGEGDDVIQGGTSTTDLRDVAYGGAGNDSIDGGYGNDELRGDAGNDTMEGGFGVDTVIGGDGDDVITGSAFSDLLFGGDGMDFVNGGFGSDRVNGGAGADTFYHLGIATHGSDWIQDFSHAEGDKLVWGGGAATEDQFQVNFASTEGAGDVDVQEAFVIYRPTGQILWALVDGAEQDSLMLQLNSGTFDLLA
ncbi:nidogen-like domain-containing protein [Roseivivax isoporae]|uniref:NIDO domain-containing protein n=1 Tax=Roseivivax isoporae LMG 25204 TaxID=1449351 RepID=X7F179_9RHOB|nr:nidogen-like domain-containing protein [Roseivivax isoporae]ETX26662.1 hypothetical protein RISW2_20840 [Roseivivax isoporae LMG 25204]